MESDNVMVQFDQLEQKIGNLISKCKTLESLNGELSAKVDNLEEELKKKVEIEKNYSAQKALIRSKVDNILEKLNNFTNNRSE